MKTSAALKAISEADGRGSPNIDADALKLSFLEHQCCSDRTRLSASSW